jgi:hypothetical protein
MATRTDAGRQAERVSDRFIGVHDETRAGILTGEFWTMVVVAAAVLIAAAIADNFAARSAWWIVAVLASAYIVSRGLAKSGTSHRAPGRGN